MLPWRARWSIRDVIVVYVLRLAVGLALVRLALPLFGAVGPVAAEVSDRVLVVALVAGMVARRRGGGPDGTALGLAGTVGAGGGSSAVCRQFRQ